MAKYTTPFSPFYGRIGNIVGSSWKGISYIRSNRSAIKKAPTRAQLAERMKFSILIKFVTALRSLLMITFNATGLKMTSINRAHSYNRIALIGSYPGFVLDYSKVLIAVGPLLNADIDEIWVADNSIHFRWREHSGTLAGKKDVCIMAAYSSELNQCIYSVGPAVREDCVANLYVEQFKNRLVHTWICFSSGNEVSTSIYTGSVVV